MAQPNRVDRDDYAQSDSTQVPFQGVKSAVVLPLRRVIGGSQVEENREEPGQNDQVVEDRNSTLENTLRNIPGDWSSITDAITQAPTSIADTVKAILAARDAGDQRAYALAVWAALVLIPRTGLHLASWILAHPYRTLAIGVAVLITYLTA